MFAHLKTNMLELELNFRPISPFANHLEQSIGVHFGNNILAKPKFTHFDAQKLGFLSKIFKFGPFNVQINDVLVRYFCECRFLVFNCFKCLFSNLLNGFVCLLFSILWPLEK